MSYTNYKVSSLPSFVANNHELISKSVAEGAPTLRRVTIQRGVKGSAYLNFLSTDVDFQAGGACGFNAAGTVEFTQRTIATAQIKKDIEICIDNLIGKWPEYEVAIPADKRGELPFEAFVLAELINETNDQIEKAIWQGDTTSQDANLKQFDGWLEILGDESGTVDVSVASGSTVWAAIKATILSIPATALKKGAEVYLAPELFLRFTLELVEKNLFHYNPATPVNEILFPGTNVNIVSTPGLAGSLKMVATYPKNLYYGTDEEDSESRYRVVYDEKNDTFAIKFRWNSGVQVAFPDLCVLTVLAGQPAFADPIGAIATSVSGINTVMSDAHDSENHAIKTKAVTV